ncbi:MAG: ribonuclease Z [Promethearchaeota archaeon]
MKIVFLGVGGGMPSQIRALPAVALKLNGQIILWDCGEGTQMQLQRVRFSLQRITEIFISHLHGDHVLGLPGLLSSMALLRREKPLAIFGPPGIKAFVEKTLTLTHVQPEYEITTREIRRGVISRHTRYTMECLPAIHSVPAFSFVLRIADTPGKFNPIKAQSLGVPKGPLWKQLQLGKSVKMPAGKIIRPSQVLGPPSKGVSIAYSGDTKPNPKFAKAAHGVALLIHDATFSMEHTEKADEYGHSTAAQAAEIAKQAKAQQLALVQISPRYETNEKHEKEAQEIFPKSFVPEELQIIEIVDFIRA